MGHYRSSHHKRNFTLRYIVEDGIERTIVVRKSGKRLARVQIALELGRTTRQDQSLIAKCQTCSRYYRQSLVADFRTHEIVQK